MKTRFVHLLFLGAIFFSAAALLIAGSWYCYTSTFDTGTVGLMAVNIANGDTPLFYYGQPYFGALEAYLAACFVFFFGFSEFIISLSPITFTLAWIVFTYFLFTRIHNPAAGIVAAACAAFPGYYIFWYSIATYGGYPAILCIGTALLWLSLRMLQERVKGLSLIVHAAGIGVLMGLGIWVHALIFPYILISSCILGLFVLRERFRPDIILSLAGAAGIALLGFLPFYIETGSFLGGVSEPVHLSWDVITKALHNLFVVNSHELIVWNFTHTFDSPVIRYLALYSGLAVLFAAVPLSVYAFMASQDKELRRVNYLVPFLFCLLFLTLYVQHHLATVRAPRYAMSFLIMLCCMLWALAIAGQHNKTLKRISIGLFCIWNLYQVTGTVLFITGNHSHARQEQMVALDVVSTARDRKLQSVVTYGDHILGLKAQKFSMFAENSIAFVSGETERYAKNAQFAETDPDRGYLTTAEYRGSLENTLRELGIDFTVDEINGFFLFSGLQSGKRYNMRSIPGSDITVASPGTEEEAGNWQFLLDRNQDNAPERNDIAGGSMTFDTGRMRELCGVWMFTSQDPATIEWKRPGPYEVHVSSDGLTYDKVFGSLTPSANGFHAGSSSYIGGPWGKLEGLFSPVAARYVRIVFTEKTPVPVTEIFLFETDSTLRKDTPQELDRIVQFINEEGIEFVLADRWMSARLRESFKGTGKEDIALPRFTTKFMLRPLRYFVRPEKGQAVLCDAAVADECGKALVSEYGSSIISARLDLQNYSIFSLAVPEKKIDRTTDSALLWNGHFPLQTKDDKLLPRWLHSYGVPVWRADFTKTSGIYRDSWTNGKGVFRDLEYVIDHDMDSELLIHTNGWRPGPEMSTLQLEVLANGKISLEFRDKVGNTYVFKLSESLKSLDSITLRSTTFVPPGADTRNLGLDVAFIEIR